MKFGWTVFAKGMFGSDVCGCELPGIAGPYILCPGAAEPVGEISGCVWSSDTAVKPAGGRLTVTVDDVGSPTI
jgi:hypothetical protein